MPAPSFLISAASEQFYPVADKQGRACKSGAAGATRALQHDRSSQGRAGVPWAPGMPQPRAALSSTEKQRRENIPSAFHPEQQAAPGAQL